jgi:ubiquinone/menaquinone biosynthesis C-methylase UbiE
MDKIIQRFYDNSDEGNRLTSGDGALELQRSKNIISRYLPPRSLKILDIGGGTGPYSFWLSGMGHQVYLLDANRKHVHLASERNDRESSRLAFIGLGEAGHLPFSANDFDVVLLMGPLYHLDEPQQRQEALLEAKRVLKEGGLLFSAYISRFASLLDGYQSGYMIDPEFQSIVSGDLATGKHHGSADGTTKYFTNAYLHHPEDIEGEAASAGFRVVDLLAVESFGWLIPDFMEYWKNEERRQLLLKTIGLLEKDKSLIGMSSHLMLVCKK